MRPVFGHSIHGLAHQLRHLFVGDVAGASGLDFIVQALDAAFDKALAQEADRLLTEAHLRGNGMIGEVVVGQQHHLGTPDEPTGQGQGADDGTQLQGVLFREDHGTTGRPLGMGIVRNTG